jgi:hypothetical protein
MTDRATPETDAEWRRLQSGHLDTIGLASGMCRFAKGLERERDEAREQLDEALSDLEFRRELYVVLAERCDRRTVELAETRNQRDRLAEALRELCETLLVKEPRDVTDLLNKAGDALAAVKGGDDE